MTCHFDGRKHGWPAQVLIANAFEPASLRLQQTRDDNTLSNDGSKLMHSFIRHQQADALSA
jgi:hypothetical protein